MGKSWLSQQKPVTNLPTKGCRTRESKWLSRRGNVQHTVELAHDLLFHQQETRHNSLLLGNKKLGFNYPLSTSALRTSLTCSEGNRTVGWVAHLAHSLQTYQEWSLLPYRELADIIYQDALGRILKEWCQSAHSNLKKNMRFRSWQRALRLIQLTIICIL